ncbi:MAG TPA: cytochrome c [Candidatus Binatia bacterium]|nr:cytochrome c [Candidatus Binatia bacterium]
MNGPKRLVVLIVLLLVASTRLATQGTPSAYFEQNCSSCHTIGGGASVGPDLKNVTQRAPRQWLLAFMRNPDARIAAKDARAIRIVAEAQGTVMPAFRDLTEQFGEGLLDYIDQQSGAPAVVPASSVAGDAARGRELFLGKRRLSNGAAACIACHDTSGLPQAGGRLGPNLSNAYNKLGGDHGLPSWLRNPPTPVMSTLFRPAPLTSDEASDLTAFLRTSAENSSQFREAALRRVQLIGLSGSLLAFVIAGVVWRGRLDGARRKLVRKRGGQ